NLSEIFHQSCFFLNYTASYYICTIAHPWHATILITMEKKSASVVKKRARSTNFSFSEKELLLRVLENKESNAVSWNDKNIAWVGIAEKYNAATLGCVRILVFLVLLNNHPRDPTNLKQKYEKGQKKTLFETGGGPHVKLYEAQSDLENELYSIIRISAEGLPCDFDSDVPIHKYTKKM
ncbi:fibrinogen silencer-binding protein-like, partial [Aphis craccivora]